MNAIGESGKTLKLELIKKTINVIVLIVSMNFGVLGIAFGGLIISLLSTWINAFYGKRYFGYSFGKQIADIAPFLFMAILMAVMVALCDQNLQFNSWAILGVDILLGAMIYLLLCLIFRIEELSVFLRLIKKVINK